MVDPANLPPFLTEVDAQHLFSNIKEILPVNQKLLRNIQGLEDLPLEEQRVGCVFLNLVCFGDTCGCSYANNLPGNGARSI